MPRWEPDAQLRLTAAALDLFADKGFTSTTVADIAERAGLTKRSFFRYFSDKREALFAGTGPLSAQLRNDVRDAGAGSPWQVLLDALARSGRLFPSDRDLARRRRAVIAANAELREREVLKVAQLDGLLTSLLVERGVLEQHATYLARLALTVYGQAFDHWLEPGAEHTFRECMAGAAAELERALLCGGVR